jgi:hypothetical protein
VIIAAASPAALAPLLLVYHDLSESSNFFIFQIAEDKFGCGCLLQPASNCKGKRLGKA